MAWIRQLPANGRGERLWAATVHTPVGRITESHELKSVIATWAANLEADIRRGEFLDPRLAQKALSECWAKFGESRRLALASRKRDESHWKTWVEPRWGKVPVGGFTKPEIQEWVNSLEKDGVGGWTIIAALNVLKATLELAVDAGWIRVNPSRRVRPPLPPRHVDRVIEPEEQDLMLSQLDELFPGRVDARLFVETMFESGGRWEEVAAVEKEGIDLRRGLIYFGPVMGRDGKKNPYPKGAKSEDSAGFRWVPIGADLLGRLRPRVLSTPPKADVFTAPRGGPMLYPTWLRRVWNEALRLPVLDKHGRPKPGEWEPLVAEPLPTPHDCRHTYGTRLGAAGLERHDIMALMGHDDYRSSHRYVHSQEDKRFARAREAMERQRLERGDSAASGS